MKSMASCPQRRAEFLDQAQPRPSSHLNEIFGIDVDFYFIARVDGSPRRVDVNGRQEKPLGGKNTPHFSKVPPGIGLEAGA